MELIKIRINELSAFAGGEWFAGLPDKPISLLRVNSYLKNPHALEDDPVLYFIKDNNRVLAYRTVFPARLTDEQERFAWLSGNWVHPDYRRQGFSKKLLKEIFVDWKSRLMFTNYAPASLDLYLKTKLFHEVYTAVGTRFYLFFRTKKLLQDRFRGLSFFLPLVDVVVSIVASIKVAAFSAKADSKFSIQKGQLPDEECYRLVEMQKDGHLFLRGKQELQWIFDYPWVSVTDRQNVGDYAFSSFAEQFEYYTAKFFKDGEFVGFLLYSIRDGHLKPLLYYSILDLSDAVAGFLVREMVEGQMEYLTVLDPDLSKVICRKKNPFLFSKKIGHSIYSSFPVINNNQKIQDGDGDFIFT